MHACGHDGITAVVLRLANLLKVNQSKLNWNIKFINYKNFSYSFFCGIYLVVLRNIDIIMKFKYISYC